MSESIQSLFNGFVKVCDTLKKITTETIVVSHGTFLWFNEGCLAIATMSSNIESTVLPFLYGKYTLNPITILFLSKYFTITDIQFSTSGIQFSFTGEITEELLQDKNVESVLMSIERPADGQYVFNIPWMNENDVILFRASSVLKTVDETADFDRSVDIRDLDQPKLMTSGRPLVIDQDGYQFRIAKSVFQSINKSDTVTLRCTPYKNDDALFLCTATVKKDHCQVINLFNVLYM